MTYALRSDNPKWYRSYAPSLILIREGFQGVWVDVSTFDSSIDKPEAQKHVDLLNEADALGEQP